MSQKSPNILGYFWKNVAKDFQNYQIGHTGHDEKRFMEYAPAAGGDLRVQGCWLTRWFQKLFPVISVTSKQLPKCL